MRAFVVQAESLSGNGEEVVFVKIAQLDIVEIDAFGNGILPDTVRVLEILLVERPYLLPA